MKIVVTNDDGEFKTINVIEENPIKVTVSAEPKVLTLNLGVPGPIGPQGPQGPTGPVGPIGPAGPGVPAGGTTGQILAKASDSDYDDEWIDPQSGGVTSFNTRTGDVTLLDSDVTDALGYSPANESLSNLSSTSINVDLIPYDDQEIDIGGVNKNWNRINTRLIGFDGNNFLDVPNGQFIDPDSVQIADFNNRTLQASDGSSNFDWSDPIGPKINILPGPNLNNEYVANTHYVDQGLLLKEDVSNKAVDFSVINNVLYPSVEAVQNRINSSITSSQTFMFANLNSDISGYKKMQPFGTYVVGPLGSTAKSLNGTPSIIEEFITDPGVPGLSAMPAGIGTVHIDIDRTTGSASYQIYAQIYKRTTLNVETLLATSDQSQILTGGMNQVSLSVLFANINYLNISDRIVVKWLGFSVGTPTVTAYYDDNTDARVQLPVSSIGFIPLGDSFETVSKNLKAYPNTLTYTLGKLTSILYSIGGGLFITKTLNYTGDKLTSMVLSGDTPSGIATVKTLSYTGDKLTSVSYS